MTWEVKVFIVCAVISIVCKIGTVLLSYLMEKEESVVAPMNRAQRRHPNGMVAARKFQRVNVKGRQKQSNNRAFRGW